MPHTSKGRVRSRLAEAVSIAMLLAPLTTVAGTVVGPGSTHTVSAGDPVEDWQVSDGARLSISAGGVTGKITASDYSDVDITGGTVLQGLANSYAVDLSASSLQMTRSTVTSFDGFGIRAGYSSGEGSVVAVTDSVLISGDAAIALGPLGGAYIRGSQVTTTRATTEYSAALLIQGGAISVEQGSVVKGALHGASLFLASVIGGPASLRVDNATISGDSGSAIVVQGGSPTSVVKAANITVTNGSVLSGGNGDILTVKEGIGGFLPTVNFNVDTSTLNGNITVSDGAVANVVIGDGGRINGAFKGVTNATIASGGYWELAADSAVTSLALENAGTVALGAGSTFHTLSVDGDYAGSGGTLLFNTTLAGDDAATDKMLVSGATSGQTNVRVNNVGGAGAQTANGIEIVTVSGSSNGEFDLIGRAVGGQYEYFLVKDTGNWYLRSQLPPQPDPCDTDPTSPGCAPDPGPGPGPDPGPGPAPEPVLRPEAGAYLANLAAAQRMFRLGYHERAAGQNSGRGWVRVDGAQDGFDAVSRQLDIHSTSEALSVGADLVRSDSGTELGIVLSSGNASSTSTNSLTGYQARGKVKGAALGVYGTWRAPNKDPYAGFYVDGSVQRAYFRSRVEGIGLSAERYDNRAWQGALETGYAFRVSGGNRNSVYVEPQLQLGFNRWDTLRHTEANGTLVTTQDANGLFGRAGVRLSGVTRWINDAAEVQPYLAAHWLHTRTESRIRMNDEVIDARIPRSRAEVTAGASLKFANGWGAWAALARQQASGYHQTRAQLGMSYDW